MCAGNQWLLNLKVEQQAYTNDADYGDEWSLELLIYGVQPYRELEDENINCHGYAMMRNDWPKGWYLQTLSYLAEIPLNENVGNDDYSDTIRNTVSSKTKQDFETWLNDNNYTWEYESSFSDNGSNVALNSNQYRVVLRTGFHNLRFYDYEIRDGYYDYHFWYQTYDGRWANKHGNGKTEWLPSGTTPFSSGSSGWAISVIFSVGNDTVSRVYNDFYDGTIYSYIITID